MTANKRVHEENRVRARLNELHSTHGLSWRKIATTREFRRLTPIDLWRIANGDAITPRIAGVLGLPPGRVRIAADVTAEERKRLHELAAVYGLSWSEFCHALANGKMIVIDTRST